MDRVVLLRIGRVAWPTAASGLAAVPAMACWAASGGSVRALAAGLFVAGAVRPAAGLVLLAAFLPLATPIGLAGGPAFDPALTAVFLTLAFVAGALPRVMTSAAGPTRLGAPGLLLLALVIASAALARVGPQPAVAGLDVWLRALGRHIGAGGLFDIRTWTSFDPALVWIAGLALAIVAERALRQAPAAAPAAVRVWLIGGAAGALVALARFVEIALRSGDAWTAALANLVSLRLTPLHPDVNAAGSFYALFAVPALWLGVRAGHRWLLAAVVPFVLFGLWLSGSRSALMAVAVVAVLGWLRPVLRRRRAGLLALGLVGVLTAAAVVWGASRASQARLTDAVRIRAGLAGVALEMTATRPVFGIGLGRFHAASRNVIPPELKALFPTAVRGENAHNNFLQVLAELGAAGLAAFAWFLAALGWPRGSRWSGAAVAVGGGVAAFLVTCLAGHPLLIPQVTLAFFMAAGLLAGLAPARPASPWPARLVLAALAAVALTLPFRAD